MLNLTNMRLGKRLEVGFGTCLGLTVVMMIGAWWGQTATERASAVMADRYQKMVMARSLMLQVTDIYEQILHIATTKDMQKGTL